MKRAPSISLPSLRHTAGRTSRNSYIVVYLVAGLKRSVFQMTHRFCIHNNCLPMSLGRAVVI